MSMIDTYFTAERSTGLWFVVIGVLAIGVALVGWRRGALWRGAAWPLIVIALIQIGVGSSVWMRAPHELQWVQHATAEGAARMAREEIPRMQAVLNNFSTLRWIEIAVIVTGLFLLFQASRASAWQGVGAGLAVQAALVLLLDALADQRAHAYLEWLRITFS